MTQTKQAVNQTLNGSINRPNDQGSSSRNEKHNVHRQPSLRVQRYFKTRNPEGLAAEGVALEINYFRSVYHIFRKTGPCKTIDVVARKLPDEQFLPVGGGGGGGVLR